MKNCFQQKMMSLMLLAGVSLIGCSIFAQSPKKLDSSKETLGEPKAPAEEKALTQPKPEESEVPQQAKDSSHLAEIQSKIADEHFHQALESLAHSAPQHALANLGVAKAAKAQADSLKDTTNMTPEEKAAHDQSKMADNYRYQAAEQLAHEAIDRIPKEINLSREEIMADVTHPEYGGLVHHNIAQSLKAQLAATAVSGTALGHLAAAQSLKKSAKNLEAKDPKTVPAKTDEANHLSRMADQNYHEALEILARGKDYNQPEAARNHVYAATAQEKIAAAKSLKKQAESLKAKAKGLEDEGAKAAAETQARKEEKPEAEEPATKAVFQAD